jgi:Zn-dependent protease
LFGHHYLTMSDLFDIVLWYFTFLFSVTLHEAAHAWAAMRGGDYTAYYGGQVSLDPLPHIKREPFGMVILPLVSLFSSYNWPLGFASTPYDPAWAMRNEKKAAWMSLAGPGANLLLVILSTLIIWAGVFVGVLVNPERITPTDACIVAAAQPGIWVGISKLLSMFFILNLGLTVLNLIPLPPLDGSGAMPLFLGGNKLALYRKFAENPTARIIGIMLAWVAFGPVFQMVFSFAIRVLYPWTRYGNG